MTELNFDWLLQQLQQQPRVVMSSDDARVRGCGPLTFDRYEYSGLWWLDDSGQEHFIPLGCGHTGSETGLEIDERGFTLRKFGAALRYDFAPSE